MMKALAKPPASCRKIPAPAPPITAGASIRARLQRLAKSPASFSVAPPIVHAALDSSDAPLDTATRAEMESRFGHNFADVRVYTDDRASRSARAVNALAYTVGRDIVFDTGQYAPRSPAGQKLLAHELTHVVQQKDVPDGSPEVRLDSPDTLEEQEASKSAERVSSNVDVPIVATRTPRARAQRQEKAKGADRYPTAPNAWVGIAIAEVVDPELEDRSKFAPFKGHIYHDGYRIVPQLVSADDQRVVYYLAFNTELDRTEFAIGPWELDYFLAHTTCFKGSAGLFYAFGTKPSATALETARMVYYAGEGEPSKAITAFGKSFSEAASDPLWWLQAIVATGTVFVPTTTPKPGAAAKVVPEAVAPEAAAPKAATPKTTPQVSAPKAAPKGAVPETAGPKVGAKGSGAAVEEAGAVKAAKAKLEDTGAKAAAPAGSAKAAAQKPLELNGADMQQRVEGAFKKNGSILKELADAQGKSAAQLPQAVDKILKDFTKKTGIEVEKVPEGQVAKASDVEGNRASLRTRPGYLQIEAQVFDDPKLLLGEVTHELAFYYSEGLTQVYYLKGFPFASAVEAGFTANQLLELMIRHGGNLPADLLVLLRMTF